MGEMEATTPKNLRTPEAQRAIGQFQHAQRHTFDELDNPDQQERLLKEMWNQAQDLDTLASHNAHRALQKVEIVFKSNEAEPVSRYFMLPGDYDAYSMRLHGIFRSGLIDLIVQHAESLDGLPLPSVCEERTERCYVDKKLLVRCSDVASVLVDNAFDRHPDGDSPHYDKSLAGVPFAARYRIERV